MEESVAASVRTWMRKLIPESQRFSEKIKSLSTHPIQFDITNNAGEINDFCYSKLIGHIFVAEFQTKN